MMMITTTTTTTTTKSLSVALLFLQQKTYPAFRYLLRTSHIHKS